MAIEDSDETSSPVSSTPSQIGKMAGRPARVIDHSIYKVTDVIDGREIPKYTDKRP